jgi:hypothetical protein
VEPHLGEGFCEINELKTDQDMENMVQKLTILHLENKVDGMATTIQQLRKRNAELKAQAKAHAKAQQAFSNNPFGGGTVDDDA